ncbi:MAG: AAA family ATPase, partial [Pirellulales bacterium]|nr:AAA family ATPase [Pirellulales bacterium]
MKIDGFGVWNNLQYDDFSSGVTAVYGRNEAGKTTLMHFIRSVLYGYSPSRRQRFLPPHYGGRPGGWLQVNRADGPLRLERYADLDTKNGHLTISDANGTLPIETTLRSVLDDVDEATYNNVYAVGLREMQELGTLSDIDAARWLYSLTTGLDRVLLLDVVRELNTSRERLLSRDGHASLMTELLNRRAQLQDEIDQRVIQGRRWSQVTIKLQEIDAEIERLESDRNRLEYRARTIEIAIQVKPKWLQRMDLDRQLAAYNGRIRLPDDAIQKLDQLNQEIESHERQQEVLKRQRHVLREEIDALGINETLVRSTARIEALGEQRDWLEALERQQCALKDELEIIQSQLANEHDRLGFDLQSIHLDKKKVPDLSEGLINSLRPHAKAVRAAREQLAAAQREADSKQATAEEYRAQLISAMPESAQTALPTDLEQAGELVANLRKRLHVNERLEQAQRHEVELQQQNHELLDRQEAPLWTAAALALLLFAGLAFLAYGLLAPSFAAKGFGIAALVCFFGWHLFKYLIEDQISQRREECQRQFSLARNQIDLATEEKRELDNLLGPINGSVVVQLQAAERHLSQLEKLLPIETRRREAQLEADAATRRVAAAERDLEHAMTSWQNKLQNLGLPKDLTPSDIRAVASRFEQVTDLRIRVERRRSDAEQRCQEHTALCKRIRNLAEEVGLLLPDATPIAQLEHLQSHVRQHRMRVEERDRLRRKEKDLKETESRHARSATALRNRRELMFVQAA